MSGKFDKVKYANSRNIASMLAGNKLGVSLSIYYPCLEKEELKRLILSLKVLKRFDETVFRRSCFDTYVSLNTNGNMLPQESELLIMGKLNDVKQTVAENPPPFIKATPLEKNDVTFCIRNIRSGKGKFGKQWYITLFVSEEDAVLLAEHNSDKKENREMVLTIPDKGLQRDKVLEKLVSETPVHSCMFVAKKTTTGVDYNDLVESEVTCPCGEDHQEEASEDDDLFLDDGEE